MVLKCVRNQIKNLEVVSMVPPLRSRITNIQLNPVYKLIVNIFLIGQIKGLFWTKATIIKLEQRNSLQVLSYQRTYYDL